MTRRFSDIGLVRTLRAAFIAAVAVSALGSMVIMPAAAQDGPITISSGGSGGSNTTITIGGVSTGTTTQVATYSYGIPGAYTDAIMDTSGHWDTKPGKINGTSWLMPGAGGTAQVGDYIYTVAFTAPIPSPYSISGQLYSDNEIQAVFLNYDNPDSKVQLSLSGTNIAGGLNLYSFASLGGPDDGTFDYTGPQTLSFIVHNAYVKGSNAQQWTGWSGLDYTATISPAPVPEPGVVVTGLSMASMIGLGMVRGRRRSVSSKTR